MNKIHKKLGEVLKLERERKQITFEDLASSLKMSQDNLAAIENGDAGSLPSDLYFTLFAKSYAQVIGIDYDRTVEAIEDDLNQQSAPASEFDSATEKTNEAADSESEDSSAAESESAGNLVKLGYILGGIVAIFLIFVSGRFFLSQSQDEPEYKKASPDLIGKIEQAKQSAYNDYNWEVPEYKQPGKMVLNLNANAESWATILADGDTAIFRKLIPGRTYSVEAEFRMRVSVAIPSAVETNLNGQTVNLINTPGRRISKAWITQVNIDSILNAPLAVVQPRKTVPAKLPQSGNKTATKNPAATTDTGLTGGDSTNVTERSNSDER